MAITFHQLPDLYSSGFNPMVYVVGSNMTAQSQFRFFTKVKDIDGNTIAEFRNLPCPGFSSMVFDPHRTIETYLSYDISSLINKDYGVRGGVNVYKDYYLEVQEEWADASGIVSGHASGFTSTRYAVNSSLEYMKFVLNNLQNKIAGPTTTNRYMSNMPVRVPIKMSDSYELGTIAQVNNSVKYFKIETYNAAGTLLKTGTVENLNPDPNADPANRFLSILCGPADLNAMTLDTGTQPLIEDNTYYYRIAPFTSANVKSLAWQEFLIDRECTRSGEYNRVFFLNPYGRFDAFNFTSIPDDNIEVEKSNYDRLQGGFTNDAGTGYGFGISQRERSQFFTNVRQRYTLVSGLIDTETAEWLKDLITSPLVYMIVDDQFMAINIEDTSYKAENTLKNKAITISLNVSLSVDTQRQRL